MDGDQLRNLLAEHGIELPSIPKQEVSSGSPPAEPQANGNAPRSEERETP